MNILRCKRCNREIPDPKRKNQRYCPTSDRNCAFYESQERLKKRKTEIQFQLEKLSSLVSEASSINTKLGLQAKATLHTAGEETPGSIESNSLGGDEKLTLK